MKKLSQLMFLLVFSLVTIVITSSNSFAVPSFARQTQMECSSCHFQHMPALNSFGRAFKQGGYVDAAFDLIEGENNLSLPAVFPVSMVTKIRIQRQDNDTGTGKATSIGEYQNPDELAILIAGRASENLGYFLEDGFGGVGNFKVDMNWEMGAGKIHVIPFFTDAFGPGFVMETKNTGAVRNQRSNEDRKAISVHQKLGIGAGGAEGFGFAYTQPEFYASIVLFTPEHHASGGIDAFANYVNAAFFFEVAGFDMGVGVQSWSGESKLDDGAIEKKVARTGIDFQAQGEAGGMPLGVYFNYATVGKDDFGGSVWSFAGTDDVSGMSLVAELGVIPNQTSVSLGYLTADDGTDSMNNIFFGVNHLLAQNVSLSLGQTMYGGDHADGDLDAHTTLMLMVGF